MDYGVSEETKRKYGDPYDFTHPMDQSGFREQKRSMWGFGGWYSNTIDAALRHDDADAFIEVMRAAQLDADARTFDNLTMEAYCEKRGAVKCKKALKVLRDQRAIREMSEQRRST